MLCCELVYRIMFVHCTVLCVFTEQYSMMCVHCTAQCRLCLYSGQYYACTYTAQYYDCTIRSIMFVHCTVLAMRVHCTVLCVYTVPVQYYVCTLFRYSIMCLHCTGTVLGVYTVPVQCYVCTLYSIVSSVVDPNTLSLDPDPECWYNLNPDPGLC